MDILPQEVLGHIFQYLKVNELLTIRLVCHFWDETVLDYFGKQFVYQLDLSDATLNNISDQLETLKIKSDQPTTNILENLRALSEQTHMKRVVVKHWHMANDEEFVYNSSYLSQWQPYVDALRAPMQNVTHLYFSDCELFFQILSFFLCECSLQCLHCENIALINTEEKKELQSDSDLKTSLTELNLIFCDELSDWHLSQMTPWLTSLRRLDLRHTFILYEHDGGERDDHDQWELIEQAWNKPRDDFVSIAFLLALLIKLPSLTHIVLSLANSYRLMRFLGQCSQQNNTTKLTLRYFFPREKESISICETLPALTLFHYPKHIELFKGTA